MCSLSLFLSINEKRDNQVSKEKQEERKNTLSAETVREKSAEEDKKERERERGRERARRKKSHEEERQGERRR